MSNYNAKVTRAEFRWTGGEQHLTDEVLVELRPLADAAGARELLEEHVAAKSNAVEVGGVRHLPRAKARSDAHGAWGNLRSLSVALHVIMSAPPVVSNQAWPMVGVAVPALRRQIEALMEDGDISLLTAAHGRVVGTASQSAHNLVNEWTRSGADPGLISSGIQNSFAGTVLPDVARALGVVEGFLAFAMFAQGAERLAAEQRAKLEGELTAARSKIADVLNAANLEREGLAKARIEASAILDTVRAAAGASAARDHAASFERTAGGHRIRSYWWFALSAACAAVAAGLAWHFICNPADPQSWQNLIARSVPRVVLMTIPLTAAVWAARMGAVDRRAASADDHRMNALKSYPSLMAAAGTPEAKTAVLAAATECVFRDSPLEAPRPTLAIIADAAQVGRKV